MNRFIYVLMLAMFFTSVVYANCSGDCTMCHPNLDYKNDKRHSAMSECKSCHNTPPKESTLGAGCGKDCFACHDVNKITKTELAKQHNVIKDCISCHTNLIDQTQNPKGENIFNKNLNTYENVFK